MSEPALEIEQMPALPASEGDVIDGKYVVGSCIAWGGMGVVFEATHIDLATRVAIKCLREEFAGSEEVVRRFLFEARAAARLGNEHVARVMDFGRLSNGTPYMVMERLQGDDLATILHERGALPVDVAVGYVLEAAEGLAEAHARGIVHRDIKPENLFLARTLDGRETLKILDFGISKHGAARGRSLTNPASSVGSPSYMPPEQMRNAHDVDARSDIWSLGVVLFELLTAEQPFRDGTIPEICASVISDAPRSLVDVRPGLPRQLDAVVRRCLQKDRDGRFMDVVELAEALAPFAPDEQRSGARIKRVASGTAVTSTRAAAREARPYEPVACDGAITHIPGVHARWPYAALLAVMAATGGVVVADRLGYDMPQLLHGRAPALPTLGDSSPVKDLQPGTSFTAPLPLLVAPRAEAEPAADSGASARVESALELAQRRQRDAVLLAKAAANARALRAEQASTAAPAATAPADAPEASAKSAAPPLDPHANADHDTAPDRHPLQADPTLAAPP